MTIRQYWKDVRALEDTLPAFVWLVATAAGAPPVVTEASAALAAKLLHAKSHRIAEPGEVEEHHQREAATLKQAKRERMRRSGAALVVLDEELPGEAER